MSRDLDFQNVRPRLSTSLVAEVPNAILAGGDSLALIKNIPSHESFNVLSQIVWTRPNEPGFDGWKQKMKKEALRQWYAHSERVIFAEPAAHGNLYRSYFGNLLKEARKQAGLTMNQLTALTGDYGKVNHGGRSPTGRRAGIRRAGSSTPKCVTPSAPQARRLVCAGVESPPRPLSAAPAPGPSGPGRARAAGGRTDF